MLSFSCNYHFHPESNGPVSSLFSVWNRLIGIKDVYLKRKKRGQLGTKEYIHTKERKRYINTAISLPTLFLPLHLRIVEQRNIAGNFSREKKCCKIHRSRIS